MASRRSSRARGGRRASSRSSDRSSTRTSTANASKRPAIDRDGKANIPCPNCGQRYKILEDALETKVKCSQCHRMFFPLAAASSRRPKQDPTKMVLTVAAVVAGIVAVGAVISSMSDPSGNGNQQQASKPEEKTVELGSASAEVQNIMAWATALHTKNTLDLVAYSDLGGIQKQLKIAPKNPYGRAFGDAKMELQKQIVAAMYSHADGLAFRAYKPVYGSILSEEMVARKRGRIELSLSPVDSKLNHDFAKVMVDYAFDPATKTFLVHGWDTVSIASVVKKKEAERIDPSKKAHSTHKVIGKAKTVRSTWQGRAIRIREADLKPLPHLETTKPEDRTKIDQLVTQLIDLDGAGFNYNRAERALTEYGKAAVPRVLNKMFEYQGLKSQDDVDIVNRLCRFLRAISGQRFGFNPAKTDQTDIGASPKERMSAMRQWFGWWADNHDRKSWNENLDEEDDLLTDEEKAARRKAEAGKK